MNDDNDDAERGGDEEYTEDGENEADVDVDGGGVIFLTLHLVIVALGEADDRPRAADDDGDFSLTGDSPWINVDHGVICLVISEAAALLAAMALLTFVGFFMFASLAFFIVLLLSLEFELEQKYP